MLVFLKISQEELFITMATAPVDREFTKLRVIDYADLLSHDTQAQAALRAAAEEDGFFYLKLGSSPGEEILRSASNLVTTSKRLFRLPSSEKMLYDTNKLGTLKNYG